MSLVRFSARNHPQQAVRDAVDDRGTKREFFNPLNAEHRFTLDVAASDRNRLCDRYFTRANDGLLQSWGGARVWCNPPYSRLEPWIAKAWQAMREESCELVVMLLPANRCEQRLWQEYVEPFRDGPARDGVTLRTRFLAGRMRFVMPDNFTYKSDRPPFGCVFLTWSRA